MSRRYMLDSNAMSDLINHRRGVDRKVREAKLRGAVIGSCDPVIGELYYGVEYSDTREFNLRKLRTGLQRIKIWPFTRVAAEEYGRIAAHLKRTGRQIQVIDMQLAAIALTLGHCVVVTTDSDLSAVPGLAVENWAV